MTVAKRGWNPNLLFSAGMLGISAGYGVGLAKLFAAHQWILAFGGKPVPCDFLAFWAAGRTARSGHAASVYDPNALHALQTAIAGPFSDYLYWNYPPVFFFVAVTLASAPYLAAFLGWVIATGAAYAIAIGAVVRRWEGALVACASPVILLTAFGGQNGFLTAALLAGFLMFVPRRPILSGVFLGLMTYKPQFGILLPFALLAGGHWRAICSAAATAAIAAGAAALAFGADTYPSFYHFLPTASHASLTLGGEGWVKMQSVYAIARILGATDSSAWFAQAMIIVASAAAMICLWRSQVVYELKAAGLVTAAMLSTPYLHVYDFPVLVVALAFLYRHRPFDRIEWFGAIAANLLLLAFLAQIAAIGPGAVILVGALILRRSVRLSQRLPEMLPATP